MRQKCTVLSLLLFLMVCESGSAYVVLYKNNGEPRIWDDTPIDWRFGAGGSSDVSNTEALGAIQSAFDSWENIGCSTLDFSYKGLTSTYPGSGIYVVFEEESWDVTVADAAGVTTNWQFGNFGGGVTKVDIFLNGVDFTWVTSGADNPGSTASDIQSVVAHEIGHAVGLDHSRNRNATMWFSAYPGEAEAQQALDADDIRAACFLYPAQPFTSGEACDACSQGSHCSGGACLNYGAEGAFCGQNCSATTGCPDGFSCYQLTGLSTPQCLPDNEHCAPIGGNIGVGEFCYDHATCQSGQCLVLPGSAACTVGCNPQAGSGCPEGTQCLGQGTDGICYPVGDGAVGDLCMTSADCASFECLGVGNNQGICTTACASDSQCGAGVLCTFGFCVPQGNTAFGGGCTLPTECEGAVCNFGKCTRVCTGDDDCPGDGKCPAGICTIGAQGQLGDACGSGAATCISGLTCLVTQAGSTQGTCQESCDVRTDVCSEGKLCKWFYAEWSNKVSGYCVAPEGGAGEGAACGGNVTCEVGLVCADTDQQPQCLRDCNASNLLGCTTGTKCKSLGLSDNPKLGACFPTGSPGGTTSSDAGTSVDGTDGVDGADGADGLTDSTVSGGSGSEASDGLDSLDTGGSTDATEGTDQTTSDGLTDGSDSADTVAPLVSGEGQDSSGCAVASSVRQTTFGGGAHLFLLMGILTVCLRRSRSTCPNVQT